MNDNKFTKDNIKARNMIGVFILTYISSLFLSVALSGIVIHQLGVIQLLMHSGSDMNPTTNTHLQNILSTYATKYRNFNHGSLHGAITSIMMVLPIITINALIERKGWKYILTHAGFWFISLTLMGGILCATFRYS